MPVKVIELKGNKNYGEWIEQNGDRIRVIGIRMIDVSTTNQRWNMWSGVLGSAMQGEKNYTVTYEENS
jgi:hypothetical protein